MLAGGLVVFHCEYAAERCIDSQNRKQASGNLLAFDAHWLTCASEVKTAVAISRQILEKRILILPV